LLFTLFTFVVMNLWNWLVPAIFGWQSVNFWQALGLLLLSRILFWRVSRRPRPSHALAAPDDGSLGSKMTPEERGRKNSAKACGAGVWPMGHAGCHSGARVTKNTDFSGMSRSAFGHVCYIRKARKSSCKLEESIAGSLESARCLS